MDVITQKIDEIAKGFVDEIRKHIIVNKAYLYGSYAKGTFDEDSDLDIAIFSENFKDKRHVEVNTFLFSLARRYKGICIEPIGFTDSEIKNNNPFVREIIETGKEIIIS